ncbi:hypothetical protein HN682_07730 [Candidatus Peregrinibacteria bacterium]|jgi:hypothetical protein|nr:hypothetical protein [Candidatus Peregrinibacteria bacterium]
MRTIGTILMLISMVFFGLFVQFAHAFVNSPVTYEHGYGAGMFFIPVVIISVGLTIFLNAPKNKTNSRGNW